MNTFFKLTTLTISLSIALASRSVQAQTTPPFVPAANQTTASPTPAASPASGTSTPGTAATPATGADALNSDGFLGDINRQIGELSEGITQTTSGLQQQAQSGIQQITNQPAVQQARQQISGITQMGDQIGQIGDQIGELISQFNLDSLLGLIGIDLSDTSRAASGGLEGGSESNAAGVQPGALMLPDIDQAREAIRSGRTSATEEFFGAKTGGQGSPVIKQDLESLLMTNTSREVAEATTLSQAGQQQLKANAEAANASLTDSAEMAEDSKNQDVSQNILRNISQQMHAQQQTGTLIAVDAQMRARDDSLRNILAANTLDEVQGENIARRRVDAAAYSAAITQGSQFMLPGGENPEQRQGQRQRSRSRQGGRGGQRR